MTSQEAFNEGYAKGLQKAFEVFKFGAKDFQPKAHLHLCELCDAEYFGTDEEAKERGWEIPPDGKLEFCWEHRG